MEQIKTLLFRCHNAHGLLTEPKTIKDKESGKLSETAKTLVNDMWLQNTYGFKKPLMTDAIYKGLICEQDTFALAQSILGGEFRKRFNKTIQNDYIIGTPDIVLENEDYVEDVKTSWDLETFFYAECTPTYMTQAQCYMWLTGKQNYRLIYGLVPTPYEMILDEQRRASYRFGMDYEQNEDYQKISEQIEHNNEVIKSIPIEKRVKVFEFKYNEDVIAKLIQQIEKARNYYDTIVL